ncbi:hypothetical protein L208DRAFT_1398885, partial [Tricholoma matsutake]
IINYPSNVPSVTQIHPAIANNPNILNVQAFQGVHASKAIGTPVDPLAVIDVEGTIEVLSAFKRTLPGVITDPIIETAKNYALLEFGLQPGVGVFTDGDGHNLALTICGQAALPAAAQKFQPNAAHLDIFQLVIFYNDNFEIIAGDPVAMRRYKVCTWLVEQE